MSSSAAPSLRRQSIQSVAWTLLSYGGSQALRLASNLLLTRLLAPEHFGVMAIVTVFLIGLSMFSDIGLGPNIVQSPRSREPDFLNTAFTLQFMRGVALWLVCVLAGYPLALFYGEPTLTWLIPGAGLVSIIYGLNSTNVFTVQRDLNLVRLTVVELSAQVSALVLMVGLAGWKPSVWVLVAGSLVAAAVKVVASHWWLPGIRNRFHWDTRIAGELVRFGRWIFLSTLLSFASNSTASLILGKFVSMAEVGVFSIAATLAKAVEQAFEQIAQRVLLPVYTQIRHSEPALLRSRVRKIRLGVMSLFLPMLWTLACLGEWLVGHLFDSRYQGAGWILRAYALGLVPVIVAGIGPFYLALGNARLMMWMSAIKLLSYLGAMWLGWTWGGTAGLVVGMSCFTVFVYLADVINQWRHGIWLPALDLAGFSATALVVGGFHSLWGWR